MVVVVGVSRREGLLCLFCAGRLAGAHKAVGSMLASQQDGYRWDLWQP